MLKFLIIFLLFLIVVMLAYIAIVGAVIFNLLSRIAADVQALTRRKIKEIASDLVNLGYELVKREDK